MADNIVAPATGAVIATDQIGTTHYPRSKTGFGAEGVYNDVSTDNPLPVLDQAVASAVAALVTALGGAVYYPATQPVSLAAPVAVTGTFFQAIQQISAAALPLPAGAATQTTLAALLAVGTETYTLASNVTLAAGASGPTVTVPRGGYFFFDASFAGTSPSLKLQRLGADGTTWIDVVTRTAVGSGDPVGIPNGSQLRVTNAGTNAMTAVSAVLG